MKKLILIISISILLLSCSQKRQPTLDDMIGQMLMVGFYGMEAGPETRIAKEIKQYKPGGVILFDYNPETKKKDRNIKNKEQLSKLIKQLQSASSTPLFVAVDQEGGLVSRLKEPYGFKKPCPAEFIGEVDNPDATREWSQLIAEQLSSVGFNLNFAPVVDVAVNPDCPVIAKLHRSISSDPVKVLQHASTFIDEHHKHNILTAVKHFPGHGSSLNDSHEGFTDITDTWSEIELIPYKGLITENKLDMIMTAHIFNAKIDSLYPATMSDKTINGLLRKELGWNGVVVSDGLYMKAIHDNYQWEEVIEKSVNAGVDILLFASPKSDEEIMGHAFSIIKSLVMEGKISKERIEESYNRIISLKSNLNRN